MTSYELYNTQDKQVRSSKQRRKLREQKQKEREAKRDRLLSLSEISGVNKKPSYVVPVRNSGKNISHMPRHSPVTTEKVELSEEMLAREMLAREEIERKKKCVAPAFNKGAYTYIASEEQAKWVGRK